MRVVSSARALNLNLMRVLVLGACVCGWGVLAGGVLVPIGGAAWSLADPGRIATDVVGTPGAWVLAKRSVVLSGTATLGSLLLGVVPAAVLGGCSRRAWPWLTGLALAPLIVPPQVYAYAWGLVLHAGGIGSGGLALAGPQGQIKKAVIAGLISAGWLWPVVALVLGSGWRSTGRAVYRLALLDASGTVAFFRAVLPSLRVQFVAAGALVVWITLIEYPIPHLSLSRVWATELMVLVDVGAPRGQIVAMAAQPLGVAVAILLLAALVVRGSGGWLPLSEDDATAERFERLNRGTRAGGIGPVIWIASGLVWLGTLGVPIGLMLANLRVGGAWIQGLTTFAREWSDSLQVSAAAGFLAVLLGLATVGLWQASQGRWFRRAGLVAMAAAVIPPPALAAGYILAFNRAGWVGELYAERPVIWMLALVGRYGGVAVAVAWLTLGRRQVVGIEQARVDGGNSLDILGHVLLPVLWPSLLSAGLIVTVLGLFEVVVTQMTRPPAYGSIAMTILNYMHYGRDDAVITTTLTFVAAGVVLMQVCGHLLTRAGTRA